MLKEIWAWVQICEHIFRKISQISDQVANTVGCHDTTRMTLLLHATRIIVRAHLHPCHGCRKLPVRREHLAEFAEGCRFAIGNFVHPDDSLLLRQLLLSAKTVPPGPLTQTA